MSHGQVYKRDANPHFGLLFDGTERETHTHTEGEERTEEEKDTSC